jgi:catechol 2,3-dioxygenase-like lactoylglutathione lyase family enzyme
MLDYAMVGCTNLKRAAAFYDAIFAPLGYTRASESTNYVLYGPKNAPAKAQFYVTKPYNKKAMTAGNGTMITVKAKSPKALAAFHAAALANGGKDEGKPGPRPAGSNMHYAYIRDLDGNKICASCKAR